MSEPAIPRTRIERHAIGDLADWRGSLRNVRARREVLLQRDPLPSDAAELAGCDLDGLAVSALFDDTAQDVPALAAEAAASAAAAALVGTMAGGSVILNIGSGVVRELPTGPNAMTPALWRDELLLACAVHDRDAIELLCAPASIDACQLAPPSADAFWPALCRAYAAVTSKPQEAGPLAEVAMATMDAASIASSEVVAMIERPLLELAAAACAGDAARWETALGRALRAHRDYYGGEGRRFDRAGFVAVGIAGLCALARGRGLPVRVASDYLPAALVEAPEQDARNRVVYRYPVLTIYNPDEARWFLDLTGFPRERRSHRLVDVDGRLVARYEAHGAPGLPHAMVDFIEAEAGAAAGAARAALDAGELLWLAERFATAAGRAGLPEPERRACLSEAADLAAAALERIRAAPSIEAALVSERGRRMFAAEPGRFQLERIAAYRDAIAWYADPEPAKAAGDDAKKSALAMVEVIRAQVLPVLQAIARDRDGAFVRSLKPHEADYGLVFAPEAVEAARSAFARLWDGRLDIDPPSPEHSEIRCFVAPAGMLAEDNELSRHFPSGYRAIAVLLNPHRVWVCWKYTRPGQSVGLAYDGLVWCDDHWAWFPKPYRVLKQLVAGA